MTRAPQVLAGALAAEQAMKVFGIEELQICPWALREGLILRRLDALARDKADEVSHAPGVGHVDLARELKRPQRRRGAPGLRRRWNMLGADIPVALSTSSVYPLGVTEGFSIAEDLGYDGVEVMVTHRTETQQAEVLNRLSQKFGMEVLAIHAPTLLLTQQVWGSAWEKLAKSAQLALDVGCGVVVAHPPFRWQAGYAERFAEGIAEIEERTG